MKLKTDEDNQPMKNWSRVIIETEINYSTICGLLPTKLRR